MRGVPSTPGLSSSAAAWSAFSVTKGGLGIGDLLQAIDRASCIDTLPQIVSMELDPATESFSAFVHEWSLRPYAIASV